MRGELTEPDSEEDELAEPDADRAAILARRRVFVRRAIVSIGVIVGGLASTDCAAPQACLRFAPDVPTDEAPDAASDASAPDASPSDGAVFDRG